MRAKPGSACGAPRRLHIVLGVWGRAHIERWATTSLPSQLSAGNLPMLARLGVPVDYHLLTAADDVPLVEACAAGVAQYAALHIHAFEATRVVGQSFHAHMSAKDGESAKKRVLNGASAYWIIEQACAQGGDPAVCLLDNDFVLADGALAGAWDMMRRGAKAVMVPVLRLALERTAALGEALAALHPGGPGISADTLCALIPDGLHPLSARLCADSARFSNYPTSVLWRVGREGWLCRSFMPHPLMVLPVRGRWPPLSTVDYTYAQSMHRGEADLWMPGPQDKVVVLKRTPERVYDVSGAKPAQLSAGQMARFLFFQTSRVHRWVANQPVRLAAPDAAGAEEAWAQAERESQQALDGWYAHLDANGAGVTISEPELAQLWKDSHYGGIERFLCPGRIDQLARERPVLEEIRQIVAAMDTAGDLRQYLARRGMPFR